MPLASGTRLGPYEVLAPLGAGGMGEVYRARDRRLEREVAVKVLPERMAHHPEALTRFEREAKAVAALSHPNILAVFDVGTDHGVSFVVTELLEGETLRSRIGRSSLPSRKAIEIGAAVAEGLSAAHAKGIVHRDLKPENIFLTSDGRVKVLDFGLARTTAPAVDVSSAPTQTEAGTVMGTVGYMSPEQVRGTTAEVPSDIFSLGCVLYEMVSGHRAFAQPTTAETMTAILNSDPKPLAQSGKEISPELERLIAHCLEKSPRERFQSAHDLAYDLRAILSDSGSAKTIPKRRSFRGIAWAAAAVGLAAVALYVLLGRGATIDSIAVLPLVNASGDPGADYLSDGIAESVTHSLSQLPKLRVVPGSTVSRFKGRDLDPQKIGRDLGVRAVLIGKVVQRGDTLTIRAELVDVSRESLLWGEQYNRKVADVLALQEEIARDISDKLRLKLTGEEQKRLARRYTENSEAYQLYLKGRFYWNKRTGAGLQKGIEYFQQAIEKDPAFARAYAGLADCYDLLSLYASVSSHESFPKAKTAARKALEIDEQLAEAHTSLAYALAFYDWDWPGARKEFQRAIQLNPNYPTAHHWYALYLTNVAQLDEAVAEMERAQRLDPLSLIIARDTGRVLSLARRYDQAIEQLRKTLEMDPNFTLVHDRLGLAYLGKSMFAEAIAEFQKEAAITPGSLDTQA